MWRVAIGGLRILHLRDNGPLTDDNVRELGPVDILMMPIDAKEQILNNAEVEPIRRTIRTPHLPNVRALHGERS